MKKIIFCSGDYPYFGGAATNIYALVKWINDIKIAKALCIYYFQKDLHISQLDSDVTGSVYHIKDFNDTKIRNNITNFLKGEPDIIYAKKIVLGSYLKKIFPNSKIIYILSSVISSELNWENIKNTRLISNDMIPKSIQRITYTDKIIVNSDVSKNIILNYNKNTDINIAYTSFIINNNKHYLYTNLSNVIDTTNWQYREYDIGFATSCCNRKVKNINLFLDIISDNRLKDKKKVIIGKNSKKYSNVNNCICYELLDHNTLLEKLKNIKLIIITSYYESLSNFMIEAINSGCNILINNGIGGTEFVVNDCIANTKNDFVQKTIKLLKCKINCIKSTFKYTSSDLIKNLKLA